jgi:hypothetical protein
LLSSILDVFLLYFINITISYMNMYAILKLSVIAAVVMQYFVRSRYACTYDNLIVIFLIYFWYASSIFLSPQAILKLRAIAAVAMQCFVRSRYACRIVLILKLARFIQIYSNKCLHKYLHICLIQISLHKYLQKYIQG